MRALLYPEEQVEKRVAALVGMGGLGKTATLLGLAHDPDVREAFPDGVHFVALGRGADERLVLSTRARDVGLELTNTPVFVTPRTPDGDVAMRILLRRTDQASKFLNCEPLTTDLFACGLSQLLQRCAGVPLTLAVAGSGLDTEGWCF